MLERQLEVSNPQVKAGEEAVCMGGCTRHFAALLLCCQEAAPADPALARLLVGEAAGPRWADSEPGSDRSFIAP